MKRFLQVLGGIFALLIVGGLIGTTLLVVRGIALDRECRAYVDEVVPKILADLRAETLMAYATDHLRDQMELDPEVIKKVFATFARLGEFEKYNQATGTANMSMTTQRGKAIYGTYTAQVEFSTGPADVSVTAVQSGDKWRLNSFHISSTALLDDATQSGNTHTATGKVQNGLESERPLPLMNLSREYATAVAAVADRLRLEGEDPDVFHADLDVVEDGKVIIFHLWHITAFAPENEHARGNPGGKCRDIRYDRLTGETSDSLFWQ
jgi:hypothetical protein